MITADLPNVDEVALGAFFEDIGKFMQRAFGATRMMDPATRARDSEILPPDGHGGYTHKHALWTEAFFAWMEKQGLSFPDGINLGNVRDAAVYHHHPRTPLHWLSAVADRLSAGMDRAAKDDAADATETAKAWDAFRKKPLVCIFDQIQIGRGNSPTRKAYPLVPLAPKAMFPADVGGDDLPSLYATLWKEFCGEFAALCRQDLSADVFQQGVLSLSERYTWAIPSSTIDDPDVSLHDHNRTVAAFAACLYRHHETRGELDDETAIKDAERSKFRILVGDLSGIQTSLFRLKSEGVKGVNRVLRARSFLIGQIGDAAAQLCRKRFDLPPWCVLQNAGGRFQVLLPEIPGIDGAVDDLRRQIDDWMRQRYTGDLVLNLAVTRPLARQDFHGTTFPETLRIIAAAADAAKQRPLATLLTSAPAAKIETNYPADGICPVCGVRPAAATEMRRCATCDFEERLGSQVPKTVTVALTAAPAPDALFGSLQLKVSTSPLSTDTRRSLAAGFRVYGRDAGSFPPAQRFLANHVPHLADGDNDHGRYEELADAKDVEVGDIKVFEQLAADAREWHGDRFVGRAMLAVLKADVDDLGFVFGCGFDRQRTTVGRVAQLSRMMDGFFTGYLTHLLETDPEFRNTYTVYAGGDDLLLIAPWFAAIKLAQRLRADFGRFVNHNPNLTLSAGIEFFAVDEPLNRVVRRAEAKLELAKDHKDKNGHATKDRVTLVVDDRSIPWTGGPGSLDWALAEAEWLNDLIRNDTLPTTFVHRMLSLHRQRDNDPGWRAKWGYHLGRFMDRCRDKADQQAIGERLDRLMSGCLFDGTAAGGAASAETPDPRIPLTIALYRNR
jgi:CRISPR-associated protein Csm1